MASNHTQHYGLCQWEATDAVLRIDFNEDNEKLDTALNQLSNQIATKASSSTVNKKADQTDLVAAVERIAALESTKADQGDMKSAENRISALESGKADKTALTWVKISEQTTSSAVTSVSISVNTSGYRRLKLYYETDGPSEIRGAFNGNPTVYYSNVEDPATSFPMSIQAEKYAGGSLELFPVGTGKYIGATINCACIFESVKGDIFNKFDGQAICPELTFAALKTVTLTGNGNFSKSSRFVLYGLKE